MGLGQENVVYMKAVATARLHAASTSSVLALCDLYGEQGPRGRLYCPGVVKGDEERVGHGGGEQAAPFSSCIAAKSSESHWLPRRDPLMLVTLQQL